MSKQSEQITAIVRDRGSKIGSADLDAIYDLLMAMEPEEAADVRPWLFEGLWLTVAAPEYEGDLTVEDLED